LPSPGTSSPRKNNFCYFCTVDYSVLLSFICVVLFIFFINLSVKQMRKKLLTLDSLYKINLQFVPVQQIDSRLIWFKKLKFCKSKSNKKKSTKPKIRLNNRDSLHQSKRKI
jgi:hypothetical protein